MGAEAVSRILDQVAPSAMAEGVPGIAVAVIDGSEQFVRCYGVEDVERRTPYVPDTRAQVGSVSKPVTGVLVQQLVSEGRLDIDEAVRTYLPNFQLADNDVARRVTCRHLLAHLAGFEGDFFLDTGSGTDALQRFVAELRAAPQPVPFDWRVSYSNAAYGVLGHVVEVLRDAPYDDVARNLVFEPLGMQRSGFGWQTSQGPTATGHVMHDVPKVVRPWRLPRSYSPFGGLVTTASDLLAFMGFFLGRSADDVLRPQERAKLWEPLYPDGKSTWATGCFAPTVRNGHRVVEGGGSAVSQRAAFVILPDDSFALAVTANSDLGSQAAGAIGKAVLAARFGIQQPRPTVVVVPSERIAGYVGQYRAGIYAIEVGLDDEGAWLEAERLGGMDAHQSPRPAPLPRMRIDFTADDRGNLRNGPMAGQAVAFVRDERGRAQWVLFFGRLAPRIN